MSYWMIHIIGTNHELQHNAPARRRKPEVVNPAREQFVGYLRNLVNNIRPSLIAEEFTEDILSVLEAESNVKKVAIESETEHMFCDPNSQERSDIGLPQYGNEELPETEKVRLNRVREAFWLQKLDHYLNNTVIFICGADHVQSFSRLLTSKGIQNTVVNRYWGSEIYNS